MIRTSLLSRRALLKRVAVGAALAPVAGRLVRPAFAEAPLLAASAPEAQALKYVEDARNAPAGATPGSSCASCGLYQGASGSLQGPCQLFPGKEVKASGWCSSWIAQM